MEPIEFALAIAIPFLSKYVEKSGERLGEHTTQQLAKLWNSIRALPKHNFVALRPLEENPFPQNLELATREMEIVANQNPGLKQDIIDVVAVAKEEHPTEVKIIEAEIEKNKGQGPTVNNYAKLSESLKNLFQGNVFNNNTF